MMPGFLGAALFLAAPARAQQASTGTAKAAPANVGKAGIRWVTIPGGSFSMGNTQAPDVPQRSVTIRTFQMAKTLVTNKQYKACVAAGACTPPPEKGRQFDGDDQPVVGVEWEQAKAFSAWAGGRLPSEAEWEYAERSGGKEQKFPWGNEEPSCAKAVIPSCGFDATAPVCSKPSGNTQQGLCDMAGNAWEWVEDWYHAGYKGAPTDGSAWEEPGSVRVRRGGSWYPDAVDISAANLNSRDPSFWFYYVSFRPAR